MKTPQKPKGPWIHRFSIRLFTVILAMLVYWVLGFLVEDIESIKGPQYNEIEKTHVAQALVEKKEKPGEPLPTMDDVMQKISTERGLA